MKNYKHLGAVVTVPAPYAVLSGGGALSGSLFGVAQADAANGDDVSLVRCGVFDLEKTSTQAWAVGNKLYWNDSTKKVTTVDTGNTLIGVATAVAANPSSTGEVLLDGTVR